MSETNFLEVLEQANPEERGDLMRQKIEGYVRKIMLIKEDETVDRDEGFFELGLDSLTALELKTFLQKDLLNRIEINSTEIFNYPTINRLSKYVLESLHFEFKDDIASSEVVQESSEERIEKEVDSLSKEDILKHLKDKLKDK